MFVAGIDIGTNSMRLLLADYREQNGIVFFQGREKRVNTTRIGRNINQSKYIDPETYQINLESFGTFVDEARHFQAERIFAIGTSALRDAQNGDSFIQEAHRQTGVRIDIISGNLEAELAFLGVSTGLTEQGRLLIVDIGGGSTEFVVGSKVEGILYKRSFDIGAVRMTERFGTDYESMMEFISSEFNQIYDLIQRYNVKKVVGIGGTITSISSIHQAVKVYSSEAIHNSIIEKTDAACIYHHLKSLSLEERKKVVGLQSARADIIVAGAAILCGAMEKLQFREMIVSDYDNLEGMIYYYMKED